VPQSREILACDSLNYKSAAFSFPAKPGRSHAAIWESELRCRREAQRRISPDALGEFGFHVQPFSTPSGGPDPATRTEFC
jgi:hypothetical protein